MGMYTEIYVNTDLKKETPQEVIDVLSAMCEKNHEAMNTWHVIDASGQTLGRMATEIATILMGKHRPDYTPHILVGEGVIVTNGQYHEQVLAAVRQVLAL